MTYGSDLSRLACGCMSTCNKYNVGGAVCLGPLCLVSCVSIHFCVSQLVFVRVCQLSCLSCPLCVVQALFVRSVFLCVRLLLRTSVRFRVRLPGSVCLSGLVCARPHPWSCLRPLALLCASLVSLVPPLFRLCLLDFTRASPILFGLSGPVCVCPLLCACIWVCLCRLAFVCVCPASCLSVWLPLCLPGLIFVCTCSL